MQRAQATHGNRRYVLRPGGWMRLATVLLFCAGGLMLLAHFVLPERPTPADQIASGDQIAPVGQIIPRGSRPIQSAQDLPIAAPQKAASGEVVQLTQQQIDRAGTLVLVNQRSVWPENFEPTLITMSEHCPKGLVEFKAEGMRAAPGAFDALVELLKAAKDDGTTGFVIVSSYRGYSKQQTLFDERVQELMADGQDRATAEDHADDTVARPGQSEHHTGLAFDIINADGDGTLQAFEQSSQCDWLLAHCTEYGFVQRYPENKTDITGIDNEPWHFRYVGKENAEAMKASDMCLEEYVASLSTAAP